MNIWDRQLLKIYLKFCEKLVTNEIKCKQKKHLFYTLLVMVFGMQILSLLCQLILSQVINILIDRHDRNFLGGGRDAEEI